MRKLELLLIVLPLLTWQPSLGAQEAAELQSSLPDDPAWIVVQQLSPQSELQVFDGALARLTQEEADEALADLDAEAIESAAAELEAKLASGELGLSEEERNRIERITEELKQMETLSDLGRLAAPQPPAEPEVADPLGTPEQSPQEDHTAMLAQLLPILGVIFTFGTPALIVALLLRNNQRRARLLHETIGKMIDAGRDIPPDLFDALNPEPSANVSLYRGIILCGAGLGLGLAALIMSSSALAALCLIAVSVGLAFLLIWKLEKSERT